MLILGGHYVVNLYATDPTERWMLFIRVVEQGLQLHVEHNGIHSYPYTISLEETDGIPVLGGNMPREIATAVVQLLTERGQELPPQVASPQ